MSTITLGTPLPDFALQDTNNETVKSTDLAQAAATVVIFTCNHCPYVVAWNPRLRAVAEDYADKNVSFVQINANDDSRYPADSFEHMQRFVTESNWPFPYLRDQTQAVAKEFGAEVTPDLFVFDHQQKLVYRGAPDKDHTNPDENAQWLRDALDATLNNREVSPAQTTPRGCSIKWLE